MESFRPLVAIFLSAVLTYGLAAAEAPILHEGTPVRIRLARTVSSSDFGANPWSKLLSAQRRRVPVVEEPHSVAGTGPKRFLDRPATTSPAVRPSGPF